MWTSLGGRALFVYQSILLRKQIIQKWTCDLNGKIKSFHGIIIRMGGEVIFHGRANLEENYDGAAGNSLSSYWAKLICGRRE